jgi:hypothetical protein
MATADAAAALLRCCAAALLLRLSVATVTHCSTQERFRNSASYTYSDEDHDDDYEATRSPTPISLWKSLFGCSFASFNHAPSDW